MVTVILNPNQEEHVTSGHSWIFNTQINQVKGVCNPGDIVDVRSYRKKFLGRGYINQDSTIAVRLLTREDEPIDKSFFTRRIRGAIALRRKIINKDTNVYRLVFSESDFLPGLIIDVYGAYCVIQTLTLGMETRRDIIVDILKEFLSIP